MPASVDRDTSFVESARLVLLHALPFDARMWQAELDWLPDNTLAPSLYRLGPTMADWGPLFGRNASPDVVAAARAHAFEQEADDIANGLRAFHDRRDLTPFAMTWPNPIVAISGDQDRSPDPASAGFLTEGPMRSLHVVPDCGHDVNLEQPGSALAGICHQSVHETGLTHSNARRSTTARRENPTLTSANWSRNPGSRPNQTTDDRIAATNSAR